MLLFTIDSRDRITGTSTDFVVQLKSTLNLEAGHSLRIDGLRIPLVIPTIQPGVNDTLVVTVAGTSATVRVHPGQVSGPELALRILAALCRAAPAAAWSVDYDTGMLSLAILCDREYALAGSLYDQLTSRPFDVTPTSLRCHYVPVQSHDVIYLCSNQFANFSGFGPNGACDVIHAAAVDRPFGDVLVSGTPAGCWLDLPRVNTQTLAFQLRDRDFKVLSIPANVSFDIWIQ